MVSILFLLLFLYILLVFLVLLIFYPPLFLLHYFHSSFKTLTRSRALAKRIFPSNYSLTISKAWVTIGRRWFSSFNLIFWRTFSQSALENTCLNKAQTVSTLENWLVVGGKNIGIKSSFRYSACASLLWCALYDFIKSWIDLWEESKLDNEIKCLSHNFINQIY